LRKGPGFETQLDHKVKEELEIVPPFMYNLKMYTLYILHSMTLDRYYIGYTNDINRRLSEHNRIKRKYTDAGIPWGLVYSETYKTKKEAMHRERFIKDQNIIELINKR